MSKTITIEPFKCLRCGTELPIGVHELHGLPHTYCLPCPKCGYDGEAIEVDGESWTELTEGVNTFRVTHKE